MYQRTQASHQQQHTFCIAGMPTTTRTENETLLTFRLGPRPVFMTMYQLCVILIMRELQLMTKHTLGPIIES